MDDVYSKAQQNINEGSSKSNTSSKRSKTRRNKKRAGGGASTSSSSSKSRSKSRSKAQNSGQDTSSSRASSSPLSSSGESNNVTNSKAAKCVVVALHVIDISLGLALVIYGFMVHQVAQATAIAVCCGLLLSLGAVAGIIGHYCSCCSSSKSSNNNNNNRGLWASAIVGLMTCLLDLVAFILVLASWDSIVGFLGEHREELLLTEDGVRTIDGLRVLFAVIFLVFAGLEALRFHFMWAMKDKSSSSAREAPASTLSKSSNSASDCWNKFLSMIGLAKQKKIDDFVVFDVDDNTSMERSLLWSSEDGSKPEDYLEFIPEHERGLTDFTETVALPEPPKDRTDY